MLVVALVAFILGVTKVGGLAAVFKILGDNDKLVDSSFFEWHPLAKTGNYTGPGEDFWALAIGKRL